MHFDVIDVTAIAPLRLSVTFADGLQGTVRIEPSFLRGVFAPLADPTMFGQVRCTDGFLQWPGDIDLAPDAMYKSIRETGNCVFR